MAAALHESDHPLRGLLDRELGDVDHRAAEPPVDGCCLVQLLVDLYQAGVGLLAGTHQPGPFAADVGETVGADRQPDHLRRVDREQLRRRLDRFHDRHVGRLVAQVAEVHGQRRLGRPGHAHEDDVRVAEAAVTDAVVVFDRELDRRHAPEVGRIERRPRAGLHLRRHARDLGDRRERRPEDVAVVELRLAAERLHRLAKLGLDDRVDDHRRPPLRAVHREQ